MPYDLESDDENSIKRKLPACATLLESFSLAANPVRLPLLGILDLA